jgi:hypothetical protein
LAASPTYAWGVFFNNGAVFNDGKSFGNYARAVRSDR